MTDVLRTPEHYFDGLSDFPWEPSWVTVAGDDAPQMRMAWVEHGDTRHAPVLMLHGEPSWSFLYRKMIPIFAEAGYRAIAPDLIGFGRSDKPAREEDYSYARHVAWVRSFIETLDLSGIRLVCQDWGGLIGLRLLAEIPERFAAVVASNTFLPVGDEPPSEAFQRWLAFSQSVPDLPIGQIIQTATTTELSDEVVAAYDAPFPDASYKAGARVFPALVPTAPDAPGAAENRAAWEVLEQLDVPFLVAFGDSDPITGFGAKILRERVAGATGQPHTTIEGGGHFIQEDRGPELARVALDFFGEAPRR